LVVECALNDFQLEIFITTKYLMKVQLALEEGEGGEGGGDKKGNNSNFAPAKISRQRNI